MSLYGMLFELEFGKHKQQDAANLFVSVDRHRLHD
jgi:hypothetical protein